MKTLGIIAGAGALPLHLASSCKGLGYAPFIINFTGQPVETDLLDFPHQTFSLGAIGKVLQVLRNANATDLVMIGSFKRPSFSELRPDWMGARWLVKLSLKAMGDDELLTALIKELEYEGFKVRGVDEFLTELLAPKGQWGGIAPKEQAQKDIEYGFSLAKSLGQLDIGQSIVIQQGLVLGVEAIEGTDELIKRTISLQRGGERPILVKVSKPQQERRADLPTIGPNTIEALISAGFQGLAVEAGSTLVIDRPTVSQLLNHNGLFGVGV